ncbi:MAG: hypothetical protein J0I17_02820 ['Candidatus Kapabacteria' thiocyanatum]|uniref:Uncharacterized protein n=1 Tax=Candidatus Kapaibacterium thiocyanatum TaxID=1895771 RepID=A0A1M3KXF3_9BACT|nr:hypothetical protein ['Candidatus Kapabacteria' thiocyanatum]OJX57092.1 MAG: hypothetical protein BGO89_11340 ['Candidatus Kapabacteria' thiocyanatum]
MNFIGFRIDHTQLIVGEDFYDLHNYYVFRSLTYDVVARIVTLEWIVSVADYVPEDCPRAITLIMSDVSFFAASPRNPEHGYREDTCLGLSQFVSEDIIQSFGADFVGADRPHYMFDFMSDFILRVYAAEVHCRIEA